MRAKTIYKKAYVFDLDDCLIKTTAKSYVYKNGKLIRSLSAAEYNRYELNPGETFDFSEFEDSSFILTAKKYKGWKILQNVDSKIKREQSTSEIFILTARHEVVKEAIFELLTYNGIDIDINNIITMGDAEGKIVIAEEKRKILEEMSKVYDEIFFFDDDIKNIELASTVKGVKPKLIKESMTKLVSEDMGGAMGGVSAPMATVTNVPGIGNAVPAGGSGTTGSGDKWGNSINKKPYTQSAKKKLKKVSIKKKKPVQQTIKPFEAPKLKEENTNPYDKGAQMIIKKMNKKGDKIDSPFKKKKEKGNQSAMVQKKFEHQISTLEQFMNESKHFERGLEPKDAMQIGIDKIKEFKDFFSIKYAYINADLNDKDIKDFLSQTWIANRTIPQAVNLYADKLLSEGDVEVQL